MQFLTDFNAIYLVQNLGMHEVGVLLHSVFGIAAYDIHCLLTVMVSLNCPNFALTD